jgi:hypothetical protein
VKVENRGKTWITAITFIVLAILGIVLRSFFVTSITEFPMIVDNALLINHSGDINHTFALEEIYTSIFSLFFSFVGNKASLAIYLQIVLQIISIVFIFFAIKILVNRVIAWATYVICIFTPFAFSISVDQFYFMIFSLVLFIIALYVYVIEKKERVITLKWMFSFLLALVLTRLLLIDSIFITFLIFGLLVAVFYTDSIENVTKTKVVCGLVYVLGSILSILSHFVTKYYLFEKSIEGQMHSFVNRLFLLQDKPWDKVMWYFGQIGLPDILLYSILTLFLILVTFAFLNRSKKATIVFFILFLMTLTYQVVLISSVNPYVVLAILALLLISLGVHGIVTLVVTKKNSKVASDEVKLTPNQDEKVEDEEKVEEKIEKNKMDKELQKIKFIENPLPLPKKHVPKTLDYRFDPKPEDMHYDI